MMHVEFCPVFLLGLAAFLTCVIVALSRFTSLGSPIRAIVRGMPAAPRWIIFAYSIGITAIKRAECQLAFAGTAIAWIIELFAAASTSHPMVNALTFWFARSRYHCLFAFGRINIWLHNLAFNNAKRASTIETLAGTDVGPFGMFNIAWMAGKMLLAYRADEFYQSNPLVCS